MFTLMELVQPASIDEAYEILMKRKNNQIIGGSAFLRMGKKRIGTGIDLSNLNLNTIEENEGYTTYTGSNISAETDDRLKSSNRTEDKIYYYLRKAGAATTTIDSSKCDNTSDYREGGYCVRKVWTSNGGAYYKVTTFINIEIPLIWQTFTIPIRGETKVIYNVQD